jgi:hypothetical protein
VARLGSAEAAGALPAEGRERAERKGPAWAEAALLLVSLMATAPPLLPLAPGTAAALGLAVAGGGARLLRPSGAVARQEAAVASAANDRGGTAPAAKGRGAG